MTVDEYIFWLGIVVGALTLHGFVLTHYVLKHDKAITRYLVPPRE